jgi:predicted nucleic acid-binding protein
MLVVADSSPLIVLHGIGLVDALAKLFQRIVIPPTVSQELVSQRRSDSAREFFSVPPEWLKVQQPKSIIPIPDLHAGETVAIYLAIELHADLLLVDERKAYKAAVARHVNAVGTVRVLELAADVGLVNLADAFERIKKTDFWISHRLLDERLRRYENRDKP